jgi:hypothetical protein
MMNFENLQKSWQNQVIKPATDLNQLTSTMEDKWKKNQKMVFKRNLFLSISFLGVMIAITIIFIKFHNQYQWPFTMSIFSIYGILLVFLMVSWKSYAFKPENLEYSSVEYIVYKLKKLTWQRKVLTTFVTVYGILLWLALMMYTWEVTSRGTMLFRVSAMSITSVYCLGMMAWGKYKNNKKNLPLLDALIADLKELKTSLTA